MTTVDAARAADWDGPIIEVSSGKRRQGIPGAIQIDPCYVESATNRSRYYPRYDSPEAARLLPTEKLRQALGELGLRSNDAVLLYGAGHLYPMGLTRVAWALLAAGLKNIAWLEGGRWSVGTPPQGHRHPKFWPGSRPLFPAGHFRPGRISRSTG